MPRNVDEKRLKTLRALLKTHPEGLWIRELGRQAGLSKSSVARYLQREFRGEVEVSWMGRNKCCRLRPALVAPKAPRKRV